MENEKRMAGEYEIIHAVQIGDREIVVGENPADTNGQKYMTAFCESNELFARYDEVLVGDDYPEIMKYFGERIAQQAEKTPRSCLRRSFRVLMFHPSQWSLHGIAGKDDLNGKVIVIRPEVMRREYRRQQIKSNLHRRVRRKPNSRVRRASARMCIPARRAATSAVTCWACSPGAAPRMGQVRSGEHQTG